MDSLSAQVLREHEEERRYAMEKGRPVPLECNLSLAPLDNTFGIDIRPLPPLPHEPETPLGHAAPSPQLLTAESSGMRGAGAIFLTRYGRSFGASSDPLASPSSSAKKRETRFHVPVPGPGSYDVAEAAANNSMSITSVLKCNPTSRGDRAQPSFRSTVSRFGDSKVRRFETADPLHLEKAGARQYSPMPAAPNAFRRGHCQMMSHKAGGASQLND